MANTSITALNKEYTIDLSSNNNFVTIPAKQGDGNEVRYVTISLTKYGEDYIIPNNCEAIIAGTKPDNKEIFNTCTVTDNKIIVEITSQMTATPGRGCFEIRLMDTGHNTTLSSFPFFVVITESAMDIDYIVSSNEFRRLEKAIEDAGHAGSEAYEYAEQAKASATAAAASATTANSAKNAANSSKTAAATSATNAKASETAAKASETAAKASENAAKTSETNAASSADAAATSETNAAVSEANAKTYMNNAKTYQTNAKTYQNNASSSAINAANSATSAANSASMAGTYATQTESDKNAVTAAAAAAATSETNAKASETAAKSSETNAANSKIAAATSATNAANSATAAATSATNAATSDTSAATSATNAAASATAAAASESKAKTSETNAKTSEDNAESYKNAAVSSQTAAATSETNAANSATLAREWAGGTNTETPSSTNNSRYYASYAESLVNSVGSGFVPKGSTLFMNLPVSSSTGWLYQIIDNFITDSRFEDGGGTYHESGTFVYYTADGKWSIRIEGAGGSANQTLYQDTEPTNVANGTIWIGA